VSEDAIRGTRDASRRVTIAIALRSRELSTEVRGRRDREKAMEELKEAPIAFHRSTSVHTGSSISITQRRRRGALAETSEKWLRCH
jgi:hypothetical protein